LTLLCLINPLSQTTQEAAELNPSFYIWSFRHVGRQIGSFYNSYIYRTHIFLYSTMLSQSHNSTHFTFLKLIIRFHLLQLLLGLFLPSVGNIRIVGCTWVTPPSSVSVSSRGRRNIILTLSILAPHCWGF
jgi:hypothetical protein